MCFSTSAAVIFNPTAGFSGTAKSARIPDTSKEAPSERKSAKAAIAGQAAKDGEKTPKASKSIAADKEEAASTFDFDDEGVEAPAAKKQRSTPAAKASVGKHSEL
jgi:hypothetical protein